MFKQHKYKAKPVNGFPSRLEYAVFLYLQRRETLGEIKDIRRQHVVELKNCEHCGDRVTWKIDFSFTDCINKNTVFAEAKGVETREYRKKLKLFKENPPGKLEIYKGSYHSGEVRLKLVEVVDGR